MSRGSDSSRETPFLRQPLPSVCNVCLKRPADAEGQRLMWFSFNVPEKFRHKVYFGLICRPQGPCRDSTEAFFDGQFDVEQESKHGVYPCAGCDYFMKTKPGQIDDQVLSCPSCLQVKYCSNECQQAHLPTHQARCNQIA